MSSPSASFLNLPPHTFQLFIMHIDPVPLAPISSLATIPLEGVRKIYICRSTGGSSFMVTSASLQRFLYSCINRSVRTPPSLLEILFESIITHYVFQTPFLLLCFITNTFLLFLFWSFLLLQPIDFYSFGIYTGIMMLSHYFCRWRFILSILHHDGFFTKFSRQS